VCSMFQTLSAESVRRIRGMVIAQLLVMLLALPGAIPAAASQGLPGEHDYHSSNGRFVFGVTPNALLADACSGELYVLNNGRLKLLWRHVLANRIAPEHVLVANDGTVVTLDNWESIGMGDTVVVIYGPDGRKRFGFGLEQLLSSQEIHDHVQTTPSSRWWRNGNRMERIDESGRCVVITTAAGPRAISLKTGIVQRLEEGADDLDRYPKPPADHKEEILDSSFKYAVVGRLECFADCDGRDNWFIHIRPGNKYPQRLRLTVQDIAAARKLRERNVRAIVHVNQSGGVSAVRAYTELINILKPATAKELFETPLLPVSKPIESSTESDHAHH
jgi:hypothetical protein